ncbi:MAG: hypothetical protein H5U40_13115, partial [Polyangiaceae bacterium]|nr:hypothetical protein [Polyangiaceae bacterium]
MSLASKQRDQVRERIGRKLGKFGPSIERATVLFDEDGGLPGAHETHCRIKVVLNALPSVVVDEHGGSAVEAFDRAATGAERTIRRALHRSEKSAKGGVAALEPEGRKELMPRGAARNPLSAEESMIG